LLFLQAKNIAGIDFFTGSDDFTGNGSFTATGKAIRYTG